MKMKIKICKENSKELQAALDEAKRSSSGGMLGPWNLQTVALMAEKALDAKRIPKRYRAGAKYVFGVAGPKAKDDRYPRRCMTVWVVRGVGGMWYLTNVSVTDRWPRDPGIQHLELTERQLSMARVQEKLHA